MPDLIPGGGYVRLSGGPLGGAVQQISFRCLYVFSWSFTDEGSSLHVLDSRSLEVVEMPSRIKLL